jgi:hypothetical protein
VALLVLTVLLDRVAPLALLDLAAPLVLLDLAALKDLPEKRV